MQKEHKIKYILRQADNTFILGHRLSEWCGHGPILEQDIALTNIALDLIGQCRLYYQYAAQLHGHGIDEDDLAYLRPGRKYYNTLLVERPNGHWGETIMRQAIFDSYHYLFLEKLQESQDEQLAAIAKKAIKEVEYHSTYSSEWVKRLSLGTEEGNKKMQEAINKLYHYSGELVSPDELDIEAHESNIGVDLSEIHDFYFHRLNKLIKDSDLIIPEVNYMQVGGKTGVHTEHLGYILAELQYMQRTYPGQKW